MTLVFNGRSVKVVDDENAKYWNSGAAMNPLKICVVAGILTLLNMFSYSLGI